MTATIIFQSGEQLTVEKNADCYIADEKPEFPDPLGKVTITSDEGDKEFEDAMLIECASVDGRYWFSFMEVPEDEKLRNRITELEATNSMLEDCILEMSEIIYS